MTQRGEAELFLSDNRGVYIPRDFAESVVRAAVTGVSDENYATLEAGPEAEWYWETWDSVLNNAVLTCPETGVVSKLHQDGDLWLIPEGMEWSEENDCFQWPEETDA